MSAGAAGGAPSAGGDGALAQRYEELRQGVVTGSVSFRCTSGFSILLREGMRAWLLAPTAQQEPLPPPSPSGSSPSPAPPRPELCALFADLVLARVLESHR